MVLCSDGILRPEDLQLSRSDVPAAFPVPTGMADARELAAGEGDPLSLEESERIAIIRALEKSGWVQKDAAPLLGVSRRALNYKIQKYGIDIPRRRTAKK